MTSHHRGIVFVDRTHGDSGAYPAITWQLADRLSTERWSVLKTSSKSGRASFLADVLLALWTRRHCYALASIAVFSGPAFLWAEAAAGVLRHLGKPYVAQLHGGGLPNFAYREPDRVKRLLDAAAVVTAPSRYLQESLRPHRSDIRLMPNAIDLSSYPFRARLTPAPRLVWLRAFHAIYNPNLALEAMVKLLPRHQEVRLTMVGPDKGDGSLQSFMHRAEEAGLQGRIDYAGLVRKDEVPVWLDKCDIFLNTTNVDNTPVSVIEAMACGLCVVSTNVGGIPYLLEHERDALLVPPGDAGAMAEAVARVQTEPGLAEKLSRNARRKVEAFDWQTILPHWEALFAEVADHA